MPFVSKDNVNQTSRFSGCPAGQSCYLWWPTGRNTPSVLSLPSGWASLWTARTNESWIHGHWARRIDIPENTTPGTYGIGMGFNVTVTAARPTNSLNIVTATPSARTRIQNFLNAEGHVRLAPGFYEFDVPIAVPNNAVIFADGAFIRNHTVGGSFNLFTPLGGFDIVGGTWIGQRNEHVLALRWPRTGAYAYSVRNASFVNISTGEFTGGNCVYENCHFRDSTCFMDIGDVVTKCVFEGANRHPVYNYNGGFLSLNNDFVRTSRGIVVQNGVVSKLLSACDRFFHVNLGSDNAGECVLIEHPSGNCIDCSVISALFSGCSGPNLALYSTSNSATFQNVAFWSFTSDTAGVVANLTTTTGSITDILFQNPETCGPIVLTKGTTATIADVKIQSMRYRRTAPSAGNQNGYLAPSLYRQAPVVLNGVSSSVVTLADSIKIDTLGSASTLTSADFIDATP